MSRSPKNLTNSLKFNGILLIQTTIKELQQNLSVFALSSTEEKEPNVKEEVVNFSISCQILKVANNFFSVVSTGNYIYDFLSDSERNSFHTKTILNLKKKFQKYSTNKVKFHILLESDDPEKEQIFELEPTHLFYDIDFFNYFDIFFKNNRHLKFQSAKMQTNSYSFESEIIKNISFVLFNIKSSKESDLYFENSLNTVPQIFSELIPIQGQTIYTVGSPYGVLSSELYKNMLHKGIISNVFNIKNIDNMKQKILQKYLFSLDMLVISGNEGAAILDEDFNFFGMLLPPLALSNKDAKYISFGVNYNFILKLIMDSNNKLLSEPETEANEVAESKAANMSYIKEYLAKIENILYPNPFESYFIFLQKFKNEIPIFNSLFNVCLLIYRGSWASGIILNRKKGIILTVSHLFDEEVANDPQTFVKFTNHQTVFHGKFLKRSSASYDIALVQVIDGNYYKNIKSIVPAKLKFLDPHQKNVLSVSQTIFAVGYGVFTPVSFNFPLISKGIVSKIICDNNEEPKLIESDCKIFNGYSGGALFTKKGYFAGMIVYNVKEVNNGIRENINFSYYYKIFEPLVEAIKSKKELRESINEGFQWDKKDEFIEKAGGLQTREKVPIYKSFAKL